MGLDVEIQKSEKPQLRATISCAGRELGCLTQLNAASDLPPSAQFGYCSRNPLACYTLKPVPGRFPAVWTDL